MEYKRTEDLLKALKKQNISYEEYLTEHTDCFAKKDIASMWKAIIDMYKRKNSDIINAAEIGYTYFYDIIRGDKIPSRDKVLRICLAMGLTYRQICDILRTYGWANLYPKYKRDSIIIYAIEHHLSINELQELLSSNSEEPIK